MTSMFKDQLAANLTAIQQQISAACLRAGRAAGDVQLVAVTKYAELDWVRGLYDLGLRDFGESRPQQLVERARQFPADVRWHLIGHLQRNKVALVLPHTMLMHSIDSVRLIRQVSTDAGKLAQTAEVLIEVNIAGEASKDGFAPDDVRSAWQELVASPHVRIRGLMGMAPVAPQPDDARPFFAALRQLRDELQDRPGSPPLPQLSMGMSGDFESGILEGATYVRIGSSLFAGCAAA